MKDLEKIIEEKTERLNALLKEINELRGKLEKLSAEALKLDGAISQLRELKDPQGK